MPQFTLALQRGLLKLAFIALRIWYFIGRPQTKGAMIALWHNNELLIVRPSYRLDYGLPGGHVKRNESFLNGAIREMQEELDIDVSQLPLKLALRDTLIFESRYDTFEIFEAEVQNRPAMKVNQVEIAWAGWVNPNIDAVLPCIQQLKNYLVNKGYSLQDS